MDLKSMVLARDLSIVLVFTSALSTGFRLYVRASSYSSPLESFWKVPQLISDSLVVLATLVYVSIGISYAVLVAVLKLGRSKIDLLVSMNYSQIVGTYAITWGTRVSLAMLLFFVTFRQCRDGRSTLFRWLSFASIVIVACACGIGLAIQTIKICEEHPQWKDLPVPRCTPGRYVGVSHLVLYTIFDSWLLGNTIQTLDFGRRNPGYKWRVLCASLGSFLLLTVPSVIRAAFILTGNSTGYLIMSVAESGIAVVAANTPVLFPIVLNTVRRPRWRRETSRSPSPIVFRRPNGGSDETARQNSLDNKENMNSDISLSTLSIVVPPSPESQFGSTSFLIP